MELLPENCPRESFCETAGTDPKDAFKVSPITNRPNFSGMPTIASRESTEEEKQGQADRKYVAYVKDRGNMTRSAPAIDNKGMQTGNGFYNKIVTVHEGKHINQWNLESPWKDYYNVDIYYDSVKDLQQFRSSASSAEITLAGTVQAKLNLKMTNDDANTTSTAGDREIAAHTLSNGIDPAFLKQDVSHWTPSSP